jgi:MoaA/NifB/PqqE/SkfB family radical SAM enzyme
MRTSKLPLVNSAVNLVEQKLGRTRLISNPVLVHVEPTTFCNLRCVMCGRQGAWKPLADHASHMTKETFLKLVPFLKTARRVVLHGFGETLVYPHFRWMFGVCRDLGCRVWLLTNGILLEPYLADLVKRGLHTLNISMDAATAETYTKIRGGDLETITRNVDRLNALKAQEGTRHPRLGLSFSVMKQNFHELPLLVDWAAEHQVDSIKAEHLVAWSDIPEIREQCVFDIKDEVNEVYGRAYEKARRSGIGMTFPGMEPKETYVPCPWSFFTVFCEGSVGPCGGQKYNLDNVNVTPLREIWNGPAYRELREKFNKRQYPTQCERCHGRTNRREDWEDPDMSYISETIGRRQWEFCRNRGEERNGG